MRSLACRSADSGNRWQQVLVQTVSLFSVWCLVLPLLPSSLALAQVESGSAQNSQCLIVELYLNDNQTASQTALHAAKQLASERPGLRLVPRSIESSEKGRSRLKQIADHFGLEPAHTPVIYACNRAIWAGKSEEDFRNQLEQALRVQVFTRSGCSRCDLAKAWIPVLSQTFPALEVVYRDISQDPAARQELHELVKRHRQAATSTPVFYLCDQLVVGFDRATTTGLRIEKMLSRWGTACPIPEAGQTRSDLQSFWKSIRGHEVVLPSPFSILTGEPR